MTTQHDDQIPEPIQTPAVTDLASAARRRALLKGLGKGAALAGSAMPLSSLATYGDRKKLFKSDGKNYVCSVSGHMSVMLSAGIEAVPSCLGNKWDHYKTKGNWPKLKNGKAACNFGTVLRDCDEKFKDCFGWGTTRSLYDCINVTTADEYTDWVCGILNANFASLNYPYTSAEVLDHSKGVGPIGKPEAYAFHKNFSRKAW